MQLIKTIVNKKNEILCDRGSVFKRPSSPSNYYTAGRPRVVICVGLERMEFGTLCTRELKIEKTLKSVSSFDVRLASVEKFPVILPENNSKPKIKRTDLIQNFHRW